jgi:hypothetical protein
MFFPLCLFVCYVGSGLCDVLNTNSEKLYGVCVCVCVFLIVRDLETSTDRRSTSDWAVVLKIFRRSLKIF